jgi:hypothetical protein
MGKRDLKKPDAAHSRIYHAVFDSPAFKALSPHDVMAYLALLRELKGYNNGDLSLPLTRAKACGISHHLTLARSLRALCAVGLVATLYRVTDRECYEIPAKGLEARPPTNEWKRHATVEAALNEIEAGEAKVKAEAKAKRERAEKKSLGHLMTLTMSPGVLLRPKTRTPRDTWTPGLGHRMTVARNGEIPGAMRFSGRFSLHA